MSLAESDRLHLLKCVQIQTDTGEWHGLFTYPNCGWDLVKAGYVVNKEPAGTGVEVTKAGREFLKKNVHLPRTEIYPFMAAP